MTDTLEQTLLDKAIGYVSPAAGVRRMRARALMAQTGSWKGARRDRDATSSWATRGGDADADTLWDLPTLRERSRDLIRNAPIATGAIHTKVTSIVGTGLRPRATIDRDALGLGEEEADAWERLADREFSLFADSVECDARRSLNFYGYQDLVLRSMLESGDNLVLMPHIERPGSPYGLKLQLVEADRLANKDNSSDTETLSAGVEYDANGAPAAYHVMDRHPGSTRGPYKGTWTVVPAFGSATGRRNVLHMYRALRPDQTRGVPDLAPIIEIAKQLDRYLDGELQATVNTSLFTAFVRTETGDGLAGLSASEYINESNEFYKDRDVSLKAGSVVHLFPDDQIDFANPTRPNTAFDAFTVSVLRQMGVALELPFELLVKHFTASYSAAQAAMLEAWKYFRSRREWFAGSFCVPVREAWMWEAVARGRISAPGFFHDEMIRRAYLGVQWVGPPREHIDPGKQAAADEVAEDREWKSKSQNAAERGNDWERVHEQRRKETAAQASDGTGAAPETQPGAPSDEDQDDGEDQPDTAAAGRLGIS